MSTYDVLVIGSGLAGLSAALRLAAHRKVALVTKHELLEGASAYAQGGIAAVLDSTDSFENHVRDTLVAGGGLCHDDAVRFVVERGRPRHRVAGRPGRAVHPRRRAAPRSCTCTARAATATAASSTRPTPPATPCSAP